MLSLFERALNLGGGHNDIKVGDIVLLRENGTAHTLAKIVEVFLWEEIGISDLLRYS